MQAAPPRSARDLLDRFFADPPNEVRVSTESMDSADYSLALWLINEWWARSAPRSAKVLRVMFDAPVRFDPVRWHDLAEIDAGSFTDGVPDVGEPGVFACEDATRVETLTTAAAVTLRRAGQRHAQQLAGLNRMKTYADALVGHAARTLGIAWSLRGADATLAIGAQTDQLTPTDFLGFSEYARNLVRESATDARVELVSGTQTWMWTRERLGDERTLSSQVPLTLISMRISQHGS
jgi:hypothetical protein